MSSVSWRFVKNEKKFVPSENSKAKHRIVEESVKLDEQEYFHIFHLIKDGVDVGMERELISRCGYDRGPRREKILKEMWEL